jgi:hypothetical protein
MLGEVPLLARALGYLQAHYLFCLNLSAYLLAPPALMCLSIIDLIYLKGARFVSV